MTEVTRLRNGLPHDSAATEQLWPPAGAGLAREVEHPFGRLLEATGIIPWEADPDTWQFTDVGPQAANVLGYPLPDWYGAGFWMAHLHPDDRERAVALRRRSWQEGEDSDIEYRMVAADGATVWLRELAGPEAGDGRPRKLRGVLIDATERRRLIDELQEQLRFETVLSELSARFINLPADQVDREIEAGLQSLVEFLGIDRSTLFQLSEESGTLEVTHCWAAPGFERVTGFVVQDQVPWGLQKIRRGEMLVFSSLNELPEEAVRDKETIRQLGPRSNATFPLSAGGSEVFGALAFGKMSAERTWPESLIQRLRLVAQVFANALVRKRADQKLQQALAEVKQLKDRLQQENVYLRQEVKLLHDHEDIIGQSKTIKQVLSQVEQVAGTDSTVLLLGETGTGKELLATAIHNLSSRRDRAMVKVNCAALPATLVESELFGREKGAYTGALSKQVGRFELAHGSTIFLDEVGDLPPEVQVKLLRVLQEGTLEHLGSPRPIHVNVRVIAASNRDLAQAVRAGRFREDLFYRLNVFPITVPPLRERRQDIPPLVWGFVEEFGRTLGKSIRAVTKESMEALQRYPWPGNVRELRNIIERAMITSTGPTLHVALPQAGDSTAARSMALEDVEREHILQALELTRWRVRGEHGAAALLRLKPTTLESRMAKLGIQRPDRISDIS
jgi:formate hydrogenlyase transcriptional activator